VYQLGSTLLCLATGEPLDGEGASEGGVKGGEGLDEGLVALLREMLTPDPARRPSAEEVSRRACALLRASSVRWPRGGIRRPRGGQPSCAPYL